MPLRHKGCVFLRGCSPDSVRLSGSATSLPRQLPNYTVQVLARGHSGISAKSSRAWDALRHRSCEAGWGRSYATLLDDELMAELERESQAEGVENIRRLGTALPRLAIRLVVTFIVLGLALYIIVTLV